MAELPAHRMARRQRRNVLARFSHLPLEIVRQIVTMAAEDSIGHASLWVAQSLAIVCRDFRDAVEPVLVATVRLSRAKYYAVLSAQRYRLARTKHFINHTYYSFAPSPFVSLVSFSGHMAVLYRWAVDYGLPVPPWVTLRHITPDSPQRELERPYAFLHGITRLHIQYYTVPLSITSLTDLPVSLTHIVLTLSFSFPPQLGNFKKELAALLTVNNNLRRVLLRTLHLTTREAPDIVASCQTLANRLHDSRIWVDDTVTYGSHAARSIAHLRYEEANEQDSVWFSGRQLYQAAPPA